MDRIRLARSVLTIALVIVFGAFGLEKLQQPLLWIGWMPLWMDGVLGLTRDMWLTVIGIYEILLAALLLVPVRKVRRIAALLMVLHLVAVLSQTGWNVTGIRDTGLMMAGLALWLLL